ncbi:NUDIX hydrolase [Sphingomonas metalli]|uniref:NUDIX hydrolase n=1 Tax=Sphingomonas metalli TaxID=1779358 RepID=A0A916SV80_9SPHN|nr:NUDIX domain-containing protein [Sphingomonas metalli]GGB15432.1 NUDIX hydrolase [Sphingomonas metalli]
MTAPPDAIAAATLIVFRDRADDPPELLMVERSPAMAFAAGALVFPGGRVDAADHALAAMLDTVDMEETAHRIAAIRETLEEAGLAIGLTPAPDPEAIRRLRAGLHRGEAFGALLASEDIGIDPAAITAFARWCPAHRLARVFDTRFYITALPPAAPAASVDGTENVRLIWTSATAALAAAEARRASLVYPTRRNLERLAQFGSFEDAARDAKRFPVERIVPVIEERGAIPHLCIPEGLGYPVTAVPVSDTERG